MKTSAWPCKQRTSGVVRRVSVDSKIRVSPTGEHPRAVRAEFVWQSAFQTDLSRKKKEESARDGNPALVSQSPRFAVSRLVRVVVVRIVARRRRPEDARGCRGCRDESSDETTIHRSNRPSRARRTLAAARIDAPFYPSWSRTFRARGVARETRASAKARARRRSRGDDRDARVLSSRDARWARGVAPERRAMRRENFLDAVAVAGGLASRHARVDEWRDACSSQSSSRH